MNKNNRHQLQRRNPQRRNPAGVYSYQQTTMRGYTQKKYKEFTTTQKQACYNKQHGKCANCGQPGTQYDHIIPLSQGGTSTPNNIQLLCTPCHHNKTQKETAQARKQHATLNHYPQEQHPGLTPRATTPTPTPTQARMA